MRPALNWLCARAPTAYWRGRNAIALVELYAHRFGVVSARADAYDDAFWNAHGDGDWSGFARTVLAYVPARSIADVGCGQGLTLAGFRGIDGSIALRGFDESTAALRRAEARGLPIQRLDLLAASRREADAIAQQLTGFDLGICLEVAEHLPPWHVDKLLAIASAPRRLIFSAAHPNQGGRFHVNEQPAKYWVDRLAARGLVLSDSDAALRRDVAALDLPWWYARNVHLFERR
jgi:SAM-dependent methyltransferase